MSSAVFCTPWPYVAKPVIYLYLSPIIWWLKPQRESHDVSVRGFDIFTRVCLIFAFYRLSRSRFLPLSLSISFEQISAGNFRWNFRYKDFLFFFFIPFLIFFRVLSSSWKSDIAFVALFHARTHTLLWIPFDLRACLPCYANIKPAAFAIGPACPRLVSASALFYRTRASIFLLRKTKKNKRKEIKSRKSEPCSIESEAYRYHRKTDE